MNQKKHTYDTLFLHGSKEVYVSDIHVILEKIYSYICRNKRNIEELFKIRNENVNGCHPVKILK